MYQTKALVNIATLHLEAGDTHQAIVYYRKLLCLEAELFEEAGSDDAMPDFWTKELQCGLHLNLSIAYKTIGNMSSAIIHAHKYVRLAEKFGLDKRYQVCLCSFHMHPLLLEPIFFPNWIMIIGYPMFTVLISLICVDHWYVIPWKAKFSQIRSRHELWLSSLEDMIRRNTILWAFISMPVLQEPKLYL